MLQKKWRYEEDSFACFMKTCSELYADYDTYKQFKSEDFACTDEEIESIREQEASKETPHEK